MTEAKIDPHDSAHGQQLMFQEGRTDIQSYLPTEAMLVTNHLNLWYMLATGLVIPPSSFGGKYYRDALEWFEGWIPIFPSRVFSDALKVAVSEAKHLRACVVRLRLGSLKSQAFVLRDRFEEISFPNDCSCRDQLYLVPAPLPMHWIKEILYASAGDKKICEASAEDIGNISLRKFERRVDRKVFTSAVDVDWPTKNDIPRIETKTDIVQTMGGISSMFFHLANRSSNGVKICRVAFDPADEEATMPEIPILSPLRSWLGHGRSSEAALSRNESIRVQQQIFWEIVDRIGTWRSSSSAVDVEDLVVDYLRQGSKNFGEERRKNFERLAGELRSLVGFGDLDVSDVFREFRSPFSRAITLFVIRKRFTDLLEFQDPQLNDSDTLAAAVLFAAREGWERLPQELREASGLEDAICHRMAVWAHRLAGTDTEFGPIPARCHPLREIFGSRANWRRSEREAALLLARKYRWDCLETVVRLGFGEYTLRVERSGLRVVISGEPKAVDVTVNWDRFFDALANTRIPCKVQNQAIELVSR